MKKRDLKLDNMKGILIFLVVLAHLLYSYNNYNNDFIVVLVRFIYFFHMPLFFIISGMLSQKKNNHNLFNLIIIFLFMDIIFIIYDYITDYNNFDILSIKYSAWYVLYLFLYRIIVNCNIFKRLISYLSSNLKKYIFVVILIIFNYIIGFLDVVFLSRFSYFFIFYFFGCFIFKKNFKSKYSLIILIGILAIIMNIVILIPFNLDFFMGLGISSCIEEIMRIITIGLNFMLFCYFYNVVSGKNIKYVTNFGINSLGIYTMHRIFTLVLNNYFGDNKYFILICFILSFLLCLLFSSKLFIKLFNDILNNLYDLFNCNKYKFIGTIAFILLLFITFGYRDYIASYFKEFTYLTKSETDNLDDSIVIGFVGDLILLQNQVESSYDATSDSYDFDYMFQYTKSYFEGVDYMIGVLEGPSDDESDYSYGNFDDGKELRLNYPSSFLDSIKDSGFDLVTLANNHIMDRGLDAINNTIANLEEKEIDYVGAYTSEEDNYENRRKIVDISGIKVGILAYTYGLNYYDEDELMNEYSYISNYLCDKSSKYYEMVLSGVIDDFNYLKENDVDLIIVLPHYGTQFSNDVDSYQELWNEIFIENGADIILGDHSHRVQPVYFQDGTLVINSVGNYVNSYTKYDGDIAIMSKIYINPNDMSITGVGIIPLITVEENDQWTSIPVSSALQSDEYSYLDDRLNYAVKKVLAVSYNYRGDISTNTDEYLYINSGYKMRDKYISSIGGEDENSLVYKKIDGVNSVCFVGDSITEGSLNDYHPWYEVLMNEFWDKEVYNYSKGGYSSQDIVDNYLNDLKESECELVIINIGTNDIRYYSLESENYIANIYDILSVLDNREVILLSPWRTTDKDPYLKSDSDLKKSLYDEYDDELSSLADDMDSVYYIDCNKYIMEAISNNGEDTYLLDGRHPNNSSGIALYSYSVLRS